MVARVTAALDERIGRALAAAAYLRERSKLDAPAQRELDGLLERLFLGPRRRPSHGPELRLDLRELTAAEHPQVPVLATDELDPEAVVMAAEPG